MACDRNRRPDGTKLPSVGRARSGLVRTIAAALLVALSAGSAAAEPSRPALSAYARKHTAPHGLIAAAERGNARAQSRLAYLYWTGHGVPKSFAAAAWWAKRAAEQGEPAAQYLLGLLYDKGHGVPQDYVEAYMWFNLSSARAAPANRRYGARLRDALATKMTHEQLAEAQFRSLAWHPRRRR